MPPSESQELYHKVKAMVATTHLGRFRLPLRYSGSSMSSCMRDCGSCIPTWSFLTLDAPDRLSSCTIVIDASPAGGRTPYTNTIDPLTVRQIVLEVFQRCVDSSPMASITRLALSSAITVNGVVGFTLPFTLCGIQEAPSRHLFEGAPYLFSRFTFTYTYNPRPFPTEPLPSSGPIRSDKNVTALVKGFENIYGKFGYSTAYLILARRNIIFKLREQVWSDPSLRWTDWFSNSASTTRMVMAEIDNVFSIDTTWPLPAPPLTPPPPPSYASHKMYEIPKSLLAISDLISFLVD